MKELRIDKASPNNEDFEQGGDLIQTHVNLSYWIMTVS